MERKQRLLNNGGGIMENLTYEQAIARLDEITKLLENSQESLEKSIALFQEGMELSNYCRQQLKAMEDKVASILVAEQEQKE